ncbi:hypothetical protein Ciccas_004417, partial [Cichlidogyrus casuarinus]
IEGKETGEKSEPAIPWNQLKRYADYNEKLDPDHPDNIDCKRLKVSANLSETEYKTCFETFAKKFISHDGLFLLEMTNSNSGYIVTCKLVSELWKQFLSENYEPDPESAKLQNVNISKEN